MNSDSMKTELLQKLIVVFWILVIVLIAAYTIYPKIQLAFQRAGHVDIEQVLVAKGVK